MVKGLESLPNKTFTRAFLANQVTKMFLREDLQAL